MLKRLLAAVFSNNQQRRFSVSASASVFASVTQSVCLCMLLPFVSGLQCDKINQISLTCENWFKTIYDVKDKKVQLRKNEKLRKEEKERSKSQKK